MIACLVLLAVLTPAAGPAPWTAEEALDRLQARYDAVTDLAADFRQAVEQPRTGLKLEKSGRLYLKKPGLMRFDYTAPDKLFYVSDGTWLIQYLPEDHLAWRMRVEGSSLAGPFLFLVGSGKLREQFEVKEFQDLGARATLSLAPRGKGAAYRQLTLGLVKEPVAIDQVTIVDAAGVVSRLELSRLSYAALPRAGFDLAVPAGVRVQDLSQ
jgi:outer membrane lipoprotein carrier protein